MAQVVEYLPNKLKTLSLNPSTTQKERKKERKKRSFSQYSENT
jgi:hypothetical protein